MVDCSAKLVLNKEQFNYTMNVLSKCTDNYMFMLDLENDIYRISENALKTFSMPSCQFDNAMEIISGFVYPGDREMLMRNIEELKNGETDVHDLMYRWIDRNGKFVWINCVGRVIRNLEGHEGGCVLIGRIAKIGNSNTADDLTGLFAKSRFENEFNILKRSRQLKYGTLLRIGIDNFKNVNAKYGREVGNEVLKCIAGYLRELFGEQMCYKAFGDEFFILLDSKDAFQAKECYKRLRNTIEDDIERNGYKVFYTISAGIVEFDYDKVDFNTLYEYAAFSLRVAKNRGKNCMYVFRKEDYINHVNKIDIQEILRKAINNDFSGFMLHYQPIVDRKTQNVVGAEALLRFNGEETGFLSPSVAVPILEESGLIIPVGKWVLETAMKQAMRWQEIIPNFKISINLSYVQIRKSNVVNDIMDIIEKLGINPKTVQIEYTESGLINTDAAMNKMMNKLCDKGVNMALDDFGTGYSSLSYLKDLSINTIKLDRGFISKAATDDYSYKLVKHICEMAHDIGIRVCFEGIETEEELKRLSVLEPDEIQGYLYGKPIETMLFSTKYVVSSKL